MICTTCRKRFNRDRGVQSCSDFFVLSVESHKRLILQRSSLYTQALWVQKTPRVRPRKILLNAPHFPQVPLGPQLYQFAEVPRRFCPRLHFPVLTQDMPALVISNRWQQAKGTQKKSERKQDNNSWAEGWEPTESAWLCNHLKDEWQFNSHWIVLWDLWFESKIRIVGTSLGCFPACCCCKSWSCNCSCCFL